MKERLKPFIIGAAASLAFPPYCLFPLAVGGIWWACRRALAAKSLKSAAAIGAWFGAGLFVGGLSWIVVPLSLFHFKFIWLAPIAFAVFGLWGGIMTAPAFALYRKFSHPVVFAATWTVMEWVRSWFLTGFPWNMLGTVWAFSDVMLQPAAHIGAYGIGFLTAFATALLVRPTRGKTAAFLAVFVVWSGFGAYRLYGAEDWDVAGVRLRIVQPNIAPEEKHDRARAEANLRTLIALSRGAGFDTRTHVVWPETALPYVFSSTDFQADAMFGAVPPLGYLLTGAVTQGSDGGLYNSVIAMDDGGDVVLRYNKSHLVPYGEYVPGRSFLGGMIDRIVPGGKDFSAGTGVATLALNRTPPFSPLICYEVIFPGAVAEASGYRPAWLLNVTNDAWYGESAAPYQHFVSARLRAIEEGAPVVRAANTGISAVVDPYGRVVARLGLGEKGVLDSALPAGIATPWYGVFGFGATLGFIGMAVLLTFLFNLGNRGFRGVLWKPRSRKDPAARPKS